ncbi:hypothetical protein [Microbacterium sp. YY-01]|uniref:hypothetical protein n=1 Tax=Microbacterium sp. YY-01 TaxID=3421634 RepID=UPI003D17EB64
MRQVTRDEPGLRRIRRGSGFEYRTATGAHIVDDIERSRIRSLAIPPAWNDVWICCERSSYIDPRVFEKFDRGLTVDISGRSIEAQLPAFFAAD